MGIQPRPHQYSPISRKRPNVNGTAYLYIKFNLKKVLAAPINTQKKDAHLIRITVDKDLVVQRVGSNKIHWKKIASAKPGKSASNMFNVLKNKEPFSIIETFTISDFQIRKMLHPHTSTLANHHSRKHSIMNKLKE